MPRRIAYGVAALVSFIASIWLPLHLLFANDLADSGWDVFVLPLALMIGLLLAGGWLLIKAASDNIYNIEAGKVIAHDFTPAHMTQAVYVPGTPGTGNTPGTPSIYVPPMWVEDDWALRLEDPATGRTGWLHFGGNVFEEYPVGSFYGTPPGPIQD